jgi:RNA polymerase sigma factor (sigma-70 family)
MSDAARVRLAEALTRTAAKDARAFQTVYRLSSAKLFGICLRICGERKAAEDVLQDVFATVWMRADRFDAGRGTAITWLATIARNRAIDWRRANGVVTTSDAGLEAIADPAALADDVMLDAERQQLLVDCMETLEQRSRDAIRSAFFGGLTYAELALRDAVPLGTMKSWVRRGLARLRECLDGADD